MKKRIWTVSLLGGAALAIVPWLLPTGDTGLKADTFLQGGQLWLAGGVIFVAGLLTSLTPCVYPLIPITVGVFGARKAESRLKAFALTAAYVNGMGLVFAVLGVGAALSGKAFGGLLGDWRVALFIAAFLLLLAASMFGAFELAVPSGLAQRLNRVGGAGFLGAFLMGSVSGLLAAPCTGPALAGVLTFVSSTRQVVLGGTLLYVYALGIGVPFLLIGAFALRLPKAGVWMEWVKSGFGIALVALALGYLRDAGVGPSVARLAAQLGALPGAAVATALAVVGVLIGAVHLSFKEGARDAALKGVGVALVVFALMLRLGALSAPPTGALWVSLGWAQAPETKAEFAWDVKLKGGQALSLFDTALQTARASGKPVMIDFFAEWCAACKELDRHTYPAREVMREAGRFTSIKVDATQEGEMIDVLYDRFGIQGLPTVAFVSSEGTVLVDPRVTGFLGPEKFLAELKKVK